MPNSYDSDAVASHPLRLRYATGHAAPTRATRTFAIGVAALLTAIAAQFSVPLPFTPVPLTLQPTLVLLAGVALGARAGAASQISYLALGALGAPIFAWSPALFPGLGRLFGPTGGYLLCYPIAAWVVGFLIERGLGRSHVSRVVAMAIGLLVIYAGGTISLIIAAPPSAAWSSAFQLGVLPFIGADLLKIALTAPLLSALLRVRPRWVDSVRAR